MNPRSIWLPVALVLGLAGIVRPETRTFDLITASVSDIQDAVDAGAFSYEKLVEMYLPRIEAEWPEAERGPGDPAARHLDHKGARPRAD